jgi:S1-C subfamily serine protease
VNEHSARRHRPFSKFGTVLIVGFLAAGCAIGPDRPAAAAPVTTAAPTTSGPLLGDSLARHVRSITVRVRNVGCTSLATGSGIVVGPDLLVTNAHVVDGASRLQVATWDGHSLAVSVTSVAGSDDLALVHVTGGMLPASAELAHTLPGRGDPVTAVGYPLGGELTITDGHVVDVVDGTTFGETGSIIRATARVRPGNSGGPLLDEKGRVLGVISAFEVSTGYALAIPASTLAADRLNAVPPAPSGC